MSRMNIIDIFETMNSINDSYVEKNKDFLDIISTYSKEKKQKLYNTHKHEENFDISDAGSAERGIDGPRAEDFGHGAGCRQR